MEKSWYLTLFSVCFHPNGINFKWPSLPGTSFLTAPQSVLVKMPVNGSRHLLCLRQCNKHGQPPMLLSSMLSSALAKANGSWLYIGFRKCQMHYMMSLPTPQVSVLVRREVNGSMHSSCSIKCPGHTYNPIKSPTTLPSVLVRRAVNHGKPWSCLKQCLCPESKPMSSPTTHSSVPPKREVNGSMP